MIRVKYPIEYELSPDTMERGSHWLTVRLKNTGDNDLKNLNRKMHSLDSLHISFRYIYLLKPGEEKHLGKWYSRFLSINYPQYFYLKTQVKQVTYDS
jgi:hypothetical protein